MTRWASTIAFASLALTLSAQAPTNFSGTWVLNTARSQNLGPMSAMQDTATVVQTADRLNIADKVRMMDRDSTREQHFDLTGKTTTNAGPMGDPNETVAKWVTGKLVVTWTGQGAVAGTTVVRTETRSLSPDGKTMTVESVRGSGAPVVMVYDKR
jgi:hypothetical protein